MVKSLDRKLYRDFKSLRTQTLTLAVLVICGVSLLVSAWSAYLSLYTARDSYYRDFTFADVFVNVKRAPGDLALKMRAIPGVQVLETRVIADALIDVPNQVEPALGHFVSLPRAADTGLNRVYLRRGRLPTESDPVEVAVHEGFAQAHNLKPGDRIRALLHGRQRDLLISGIGLSPEFVYALSPAAPLPDDKHFGVFWMRQEDLEKLMDMSGAFNSAVMTLAAGASINDVKLEIDELLRPYGNPGSFGRDRQVSAMFVEDEINQQRVSAFFNPAVFLAISAFLIHVIVARLVTMQRSQIATLKAVGYSNREISAHYVKLVTSIMLVGTLPGLFIGTQLGQAMTNLYKDFFRFPDLAFQLSWPSLLIGLVAGVLPGLVGAWSSIRSVARMAPAEAMRPPAPPAFHRSWLERLGLNRYLSVRNRMVWRSLLLRPWRLVLTIFGMSAALAIIVSAGFWTDTLDFLLDTQFQRAQREDLSVTLLNPRPQSALRQLLTIDGVMAVEGYRIAPARFRWRNYERELSIYGRPEEAGMRPLLDVELRSVELPTEGLILSRFFHDRFGLSVGDVIELEMIEGHQQVLRLPVAGFTDDLFGTGAYMNIRSLWRLLDEDPVYNVATLKVDPLKEAEVYVKLKELPLVAAVTVKTLLFRGFQETTGGMLLATTLILTGFAVAIAIGIIYNSARVSFSERSWEMASLRVLGFEKRNVLAILMSEVTTQVFLSLIPGCLMGLGLAYASIQLINTETFRFPLTINLSTYTSAVLVILATLALSVLIVRKMINRLNLVDALKARE